MGSSQFWDLPNWWQAGEEAQEPGMIGVAICRVVPAVCIKTKE